MVSQFGFLVMPLIQIFTSIITAWDTWSTLATIMPLSLVNQGFTLFGLGRQRILVTLGQAMMDLQIPATNTSAMQR